MGILSKERISRNVKVLENLYEALKEKDQNPRPFAARLRYVQVCGEVVRAQMAAVDGTTQYLYRVMSDRLIDPLDSIRNSDNHVHYEIAGGMFLQPGDRIEADVTRHQVKVGDVMAHLVKWYNLVHSRSR